MSVEDVIDNLSRLDLKICSDQEISELLDEVIRYVVPIIDIQPGQSFFRATVIGDDEGLLSLNRLSYKPGLLNKKYQRASLPGETMFYAIFPNIQEAHWRSNSQIAAMMECAPCFRGDIADGEWKIAVSEWVTKSPISLMALSSPFKNKSIRLTECIKDFINVAKATPETFLLIRFQEFLHNEFTKIVEVEKEYRISALFVKKLLDNSKKVGRRIDGVAWQSAVLIDEKLNDSLSVAIAPTVIDTCFKAPINYCEYTVEIINGETSPLNPVIRLL